MIRIGLVLAVFFCTLGESNAQVLVRIIKLETINTNKVQFTTQFQGKALTKYTLKLTAQEADKTPIVLDFGSLVKTEENGKGTQTYGSGFSLKVGTTYKFMVQMFNDDDDPSTAKPLSVDFQNYKIGDPAATFKGIFDEVEISPPPPPPPPLPLALLSDQLAPCKTAAVSARF